MITIITCMKLGSFKVESVPEMISKEVLAQFIYIIYMYICTYVYMYVYIYIYICIYINLHNLHNQPENYLSRKIWKNYYPVCRS